jgi:hypothetical protein
MRSSRIPTIFYPNMNTGMDDQLARCKVAEKEGWGLVVQHKTRENILSAIDAVKSIKSPEIDNGMDFTDEVEWISSLLRF